MKTLVFAGAAVLLAGLGSWMILAADDEADDARPAAEAASKRERRGDRDAPAAAADGDLSARVAQLEDDVKALRRQLALVQGARAAFSGGGADDGSDAEGLGAAEIPAFDEAVRDIVLEERERQREERDERRREQWEARTEEALDELASDAGLNPDQRDAISTAWAAEREQMIPLFSAARAGERDFREVREEIRAIREATDAELQKQLSAEQYEKYEEARPRGPGRGGGRDGRRGDDGERPRAAN